MIVRAENLEIRGHEVKTSQKTGNQYIIVRVEDETGRPAELLDRNMDNEPYYKRGKVADFWLNLQTGKYTSVSVARFQTRE